MHIAYYTIYSLYSTWWILFGRFEIRGEGRRIINDPVDCVPSYPTDVPQIGLKCPSPSPSPSLPLPLSIP